MPPKHFVTLKAAIWKGNKLLLQKESGPEAGEIWDLPGGRIEAGENLHQGLRREVMEELGVELSGISPLPVHLWTTVDRFNNSWVTIVYEAKLESEKFNYNTNGAEEVQEIGWLDFKTFCEKPVWRYTEDLKAFYKLCGKL